MPTSLFSLAGRTALVTGSTGHFGPRLCRALAEAGATVLANGRDAAKVHALVSELTSEGLHVEGAVFDCTHHSAARTYIEGQTERTISIIVNNAYQGGSGTCDEAEPADYTRAMDIVVGTASSIFKAALPALRRAVKECGDASVINISTMYAMVSPNIGIYSAHGVANPPQYGAAKAALLQWTRYAACQYGPEGIRVNAISPGPFPSPAARSGDPRLMGEIVSRVPLNRLGHADEMMGPVLFLASKGASFVNGSNLVVDGGWTCW